MDKLEPALFILVFLNMPTLAVQILWVRTYQEKKEGIDTGDTILMSVTKTNLNYAANMFAA